MPRVDVDVAVVGAGVVGLACAAALSRRGRSVWILERNDAIARETTSRNSQVIHAGIYYPADSLKARFCVTGRRMLLERCEARGVAYRLLGKVIVACDEQELPVLEDLQAKARANGVVPELEDWDAVALRRREPAVRGVAALFSPGSGIVDGQELCLSYLAEAEHHGAVLVPRSTVNGVERTGGGWRIDLENAAGQRETLQAAAVVNAAGLAAEDLARMADLDVDALGYRVHFCKGDYYSLAPGHKIALSGLVYPVPAGAGLGIHATLDLAGRVRFGPDAEYVESPAPIVSPGKAERFAAAIGRYLPGIEAAALVPEDAGVRPKLAGPGEPFRDFVVNEESAAGAPGWVNCLGIESPGLTAAPAIAEHVADRLADL